MPPDNPELSALLERADRAIARSIQLRADHTVLMEATAERGLKIERKRFAEQAELFNKLSFRLDARK